MNENNSNTTVIDCSVLHHHLTLVQKSLTSQLSQTVDITDVIEGTKVQPKLEIVKVPLGNSSSFRQTSPPSSPQNDDDVSSNSTASSSKKKKFRWPRIRKRSMIKTQKEKSYLHTSASEEASSEEDREDWYFVIAYTPYAISAQLVPISSSTPNIDATSKEMSLWLSELKSVWTASAPKVDDAMADMLCNPKSKKKNSKANYNNNGITMNNLIDELEIITCTPSILVMQPTGSCVSNTECLKIAVIFGTNKSRVLSIQLSVHLVTSDTTSKKVGDSSETIKFILHKNTGVESCLEPLPLDDQLLFSKMKKSQEKQSCEKSGQGHDTPPSSLKSQGGNETDKSDIDINSANECNISPFHPDGGVTKITVYENSSNYSTYTDDAFGGGKGIVWINYGDNTMVRLPYWAFFPLGIGMNTESFAQVDYCSAVVKARVIHSSSSEYNDVSQQKDTRMLLPLRKFYPTLLSQPLESGEQGNAAIEHEHEFYEAIEYGGTSNGIPPPILNFFTNEDQLFSKTHMKPGKDDVISRYKVIDSIIKSGTTLIGGTTALLGDIVGTVWKKSDDESRHNLQGMEITTSGDSFFLPAKELFPQLRHEPTSLPTQTSIFDSPRKIIHVAIEPVEGVLMACTDNLGRVQLIDLSTKQVVRIWKGFRDATCQFFHHSCNSIKHTTYLAIHTSHRQVVEVYRVRHGSRVCIINTHGDFAQLVQCPVVGNGVTYMKCFLLQAALSDKSLRIPKIHMEEIIVDDAELLVHHNENNASSREYIQEVTDSTRQASEETLQLQLLKQVIASGTSISSDLNTIYAALTQITAISDLNKAIDLLAISSHIERLGVSDSSFHAEVVTYVEEQLDLVLDDEVISTSRNNNLDELEAKLDYHCKMISAFDAIYDFENASYSDDDKVENTSRGERTVMSETIEWITSFEAITNRSIDHDVVKVENLKFSTFASACLRDINKKVLLRNIEGEVHVYLCDSTRDRKEILTHIFRPLLKDVFVYKTSYQIFKLMGISDDFEKLYQYYGEWFMSLPKQTIFDAMHGLDRPIVKFLQELLRDQLGRENHVESTDDMILFDQLHAICMKTADLPRAFLLSTLVKDAILETIKQLEDKTYGLVSTEKSIKPWKKLIDKLKCSLLIYLSLHKDDLGPNPITVSNLESGNIFSIYELLARDELNISHKCSVIDELEETCLSNRSVRNFSLECKRPRPLLYYMSHYCDPVKLAAHRSILLCQMWAREPKSLHLLKDSLNSLKRLKEFSAILRIILLEMWQFYLRPIYRAVLFGFSQVHEISEEVVLPLVREKGFFHSLNKICLEILVLLEQNVSKVSNGASFDFLDFHFVSDDEREWPPLFEDTTVKTYLARTNQNFEEKALTTHRGVVYALQVSDDNSLRSLLLMQCFPDLDKLFLRDSLYIKNQISYNKEMQLEFVDAALLAKAEKTTTFVNNDDLNEIINLGRIWGIEKSYILTQFLLIMYMYEKDDLIEQLVQVNIRLIDTPKFVNDGIVLACVRLNAILIILRKSKENRNIIATLNADTCKWLKEEVSSGARTIPYLKNVSLDEPNDMPSLIHTQALILRVIRMNGGNHRKGAALNSMCESLIYHLYSTL